RRLGAVEAVAMLFVISRLPVPRLVRDSKDRPTSWEGDRGSP
ncbi:hypothetical protein CCACVL1_28723, partial [Corchorus capsularis]